jgi:hypothetical protein
MVQADHLLTVQSVPSMLHLLIDCCRVQYINGSSRDSSGTSNGTFSYC